MAAAIAVIDKLIQEPVIETLWKTGQKINDRLNIKLKKYHLDKVISLQGFPPWKVLNFNNVKDVEGAAIKTMLMIELLKNGVLLQSAHNICYAHNDEDIGTILNAYDQALHTVSNAIWNDNFYKCLDVSVIRPVFQVRV